MRYNRIFIVVTDGLGIGGDTRAKEFGDKGSNTLLHVSETGLLDIPTWKKMGIDSIAKMTGHNKAINQTGYMARMYAHSNAKDTLAGHWEMMGLVTEQAMPTFTENGFPEEMIKLFEEKFDGRKVVGNRAESGTVIIDELADEEANNNGIIVYTSADSNVQICGHEEIIGLDNLYKYCEAVREICSSKSEWNVGRIIARPYVGTKSNYTRTMNRHDYAVAPYEPTLLDKFTKAGINTVGIGKIGDIFSMNGINETIKSSGDLNGMDILIDRVNADTKKEFIFVNLVQFDSEFGHRRKPEAYAAHLNMVDIKWAKLINTMKEDDLFMITSDHGNDPTMPGSDHTREEVPVTIFAKDFKGKPKKLDKFEGFATIGNIVAKNFGVELASSGQDRFDEIK